MFFLRSLLWLEDAHSWCQNCFMGGLLFRPRRFWSCLLFPVRARGQNTCLKRSEPAKGILNTSVERGVRNTVDHCDKKPLSCNEGLANFLIGCSGMRNSLLLSECEKCFLNASKSSRKLGGKDLAKKVFGPQEFFLSKPYQEHFWGVIHEP